MWKATLWQPWQLERPRSSEVSEMDLPEEHVLLQAQDDAGGKRGKYISIFLPTSPGSSQSYFLLYLHASVDPSQALGQLRDRSVCTEPRRPEWANGFWASLLFQSTVTLLL